MLNRRLGKSGLKVSALSFGSWVTFGQQVDNSVAESCLKTAYDAGINFFDNAEIYANGQSEEVMGAILSKFGWSRDTYIVSSKVFWGGELPNQTGLSRKHVIEACQAALKRLRVEYLDLYYCHRPDPETPIEETVRAMDTLIQQGKVLYWGTSEWSAQEIMEAYSIARQYNLTPPTIVAYRSKTWPSCATDGTAISRTESQPSSKRSKASPEKSEPTFRSSGSPGASKIRMSAA